jgi:hypothetical protein
MSLRSTQIRIAAFLLTAFAALAAVPTPKSYFGHEMGEDRTVLDWDKVTGYFQELAKSSGRIKVEELGKSADGRPFIAATIADADTLKHLDRYLAIQQRLADPRKTTPAEAETLFPQGKTVVLITCSIPAGSLAQPRWGGYRDALVSQDAGNAVRGHVTARVVAQVRGPR